MRLLHTADWHLGKTLLNHSLIDDQKFILNEFLKLVDNVKPHAIIIAGDIYDRADPSTDAINLFDEIIFKLTEKHIPTLCIAGNHDSQDRLNFGSRLFANKKFYITTKNNSSPENIILNDEFGEVYFSLIPYLDFDDIQSKVASARQNIPSGKRSVIVAHAFVEGGEESDSERKFVGTASKVRAEIFAGYDYVALGHLHKPHTPKDAPKNIRYSGSLLKYSAKESSHVKGITLVELNDKGFVSAKNIELKPQRDLIEVSGTLDEFLNQPPNDAYAYVTLTDKEFVYDAAQKLHEVFPHLMEAKNQSRPKNFVEEPARQFQKDAPLSEQFSDFFEEMTKRALTDDERAAMAEIFKQIEA